jgi:hypothetical protein
VLLRTILVAGALAVGATGAVGGAGAEAAVRVGDPVAGRPLPRSFAGLSVETDTLGSWFSAGGCDSRAHKVLQLLGRPEIRVGGNSQDRLWPNSALPTGQRQVVGAPYFHALGCLAKYRHPLIVGLNLLGRDPVATGDLLAAVKTVVPPSLLSVALGNEPNLFGSRLPAPGRYPGYLKLYGDTIDALLARFGGKLPPTAGPDAATWRWRAETVKFVADAKPAIVDAHLYGLNGCGKQPGKPGFPTVRKLLAPGASVGLVGQLRGVAVAARAAGIPAQLTEVNTVACRGLSGVSDSPASALWALQVLGAGAKSGFSRIQFHTSNGNYDPFVLKADGTVDFHPLMTALVLADRLWPAGTAMRKLVGQLPPGVQAYAGTRSDGRTGIVLVDRDLTHGRRVVLRTRARAARIGRLRGAGAYAVTLDGQTLRWSKAGGRPVWTGRRVVADRRVRAGRLSVHLAPASAAWVELRGRAAQRGAGS